MPELLVLLSAAIGLLAWLSRAMERPVVVREERRAERAPLILF